MTPLLLALGTLALYLLAYHTYGKWLGQKIFRLSTQAEVPAISEADGQDYVATDRKVVFGHHFTSIAGTGPIVGPAVAIIWGWVPALIWVLVGSVFIGAVHDFGALVVSLRQRGQTVGDIAARVLNPRARTLFFCILMLALTIILAIFGLVISAVFRFFPTAIFPCLIQIPLAVIIGLWLHRKGLSLLLPSLLALGLMYLSVWMGDRGFLHTFNQTLAGLSPIVWVALLLVYSYVASVLPVWVLLQPRDYLNALQLLSVLGLIVVGLIAAGLFGGAPLATGEARPALEMVAPAFNPAPLGAPSWVPFLFITIACGAVSGFHCLVSSGTSSKQISCESDAQMVGYGAMLTEGFLAVLVILACGAGLGLGIPGSEGLTLTGTEAFQTRYASWGVAAGLGAKVGAFVDGSANFLAALSLPREVAVALMGVFVASFAATTMDTTCRLQRYLIQEAARLFSPSPDSQSNQTTPSPNRLLIFFENKHAATLLAITLAFALALIPGKPGGAPGTGGLLLWPLFGAINQLLAGLAFLVIVFWLRRMERPLWFALPPAALMLLLPAWALTLQLREFAQAGTPASWLLFTIGLLTLLIEIWLLLEAWRLWPRIKGLTPPLPPRLSPATKSGKP